MEQKKEPGGGERNTRIFIYMYIKLIYSSNQDQLKESFWMGRMELQWRVGEKLNHQMSKFANLSWKVDCTSFEK